MANPRVFVTRQIFAEAIDIIAQVADVEVWQDELPPPRDVLLDKVRGVVWAVDIEYSQGDEQAVA